MHWKHTCSTSWSWVRTGLEASAESVLRENLVVALYKLISWCKWAVTSSELTFGPSRRRMMIFMLSALTSPIFKCRFVLGRNWPFCQGYSPRFWAENGHFFDDSESHPMMSGTLQNICKHLGSRYKGLLWPQKWPFPSNLTSGGLESR